MAFALDASSKHFLEDKRKLYKKAGAVTIKKASSIDTGFLIGLPPLDKLTVEDAKVVLPQALRDGGIPFISLLHVILIDHSGMAYARVTELHIPKVSKLEDFALYGMRNLRILNVASLVEAGHKALSKLENLLVLDAPCLTFLGHKGGAGNRRLRTINLPSLRGLESFGLEHAAMVTNLELNVAEMPLNACASMVSLLSVVLNYCTTIGANAFRDCTSLRSVIGPIVTTIKNGAFHGDLMLHSVTLPMVERIGRDAFRGAALTSFKALHLFLLGKNAFAQNFQLQSFEAGYHLKHLPPHCFDGAICLTSVVTPGVLSVGRASLQNADSFSQWNVPDYCQYLADKSFSGTRIPRPLLVNTQTVVSSTAFDEYPLAHFNIVDSSEILKWQYGLCITTKKKLLAEQRRFIRTFYLVGERLDVSNDVRGVIVSFCSYADMLSGYK